MRRLLNLFLLSLVFLAFANGRAFAEDCDQYNCKEDDEEYQNCLTKEKKCWQEKVDITRSEANTLQSAINIINGQIRIQNIKVQQTVAEINSLEKEITELSERIEGLGISLNRLSEILIKRIRQSYKQSRLPYKNNIFASESFNDFVSQYRYMNLAQDQTLDLMKKTELQRLTYNQQKELKETKQQEVEKKRQELQSQKNILDTQKANKDSLLKETKSSEAVYQQKIEQLESELRSFSRYANSSDVKVLTGQTKCDSWGCYYNQRDSQWANIYLGRTTYTIGSSGCILTSVAMIATHYGKSLNPAQIASVSPFAGGDLNTEIHVNGVNIFRTRGASCGTSTSCLDSVLNEGKPVIVKIPMPGSTSGDHFLVIKEKKDGKYIMHDPDIENGNDKSFTDYHSLSSIKRIDRVSVN